MQPENKLPLLKRSLGLLIDELGEKDRVAMVVYAGSSGCVLEPTHDKAKMRRALDRLEAGGSTNGGSGIQLAYKIAKAGFIKDGTNRVILATDGDWNVGITNQSDLLDMIADKAKGGVFLTVLGFGMGNLKDSMLVKLADKGNGNYGYIDTLTEAKKLLVEQISGTLVTIAKDVKIQVEFNPAQAAGYRLIGYEKRLLAKEDFNDDKKDAGEIGAGHTVTALYEVVPAGKDVPDAATVDALKYQAPAGEKPGTKNQEPGTSPELLTLKLRYKAPDGDTSKLLAFPLTDTGAPLEKSSRDFRFAAAVAGYGMLLRDSPHKGSATWDSVRKLAIEGKGEDATGYRAEFISLLEKAQSLKR
jgi:Ca-activated chloride channel family protein